MLGIILLMSVNVVCCYASQGAHNLNNMSCNLSEQLTRNVDKRYHISVKMILSEASKMLCSCLNVTLKYSIICNYLCIMVAND